MTKLSIIVRFRNEGSYLEAVLRAVREQHCQLPVEVVAIDNSSTDDSLEIASRYADVVLDINEYKPGAALNHAIESCSGDALVVLSAHAIPANRSWLENLTAWLPNPQVLGTYGAQVYPITSRFLDKRDLDIFSDLRPRTERHDSDFWNANSTFTRGHWEKERFDETVIELEDHHWTKKLLPQSGMWVRFEPAAPVYHYGHEARNDRSFLPPSPMSDTERIAAAIQVLESAYEPWPAVMSAGLTLRSLAGLPEVETAVPALGRVLLSHDDFDVRWRVASALGRIGTPAAASFLVQGLRDPSFYARDESAWALARCGSVGVAALEPRLAALPIETRPFAALALGLSGDGRGEGQAVELLSDSLGASETAIVRDALYFLGEVAHVSGVRRLAPTVSSFTRSSCDEVVRAAAWCSGMLAASSDDPGSQDERELAELARQHPVETLRFEAIVALGRMALARRSGRLVHEVSRALREDGAGRVRYAAMQSLRLMASAGLADLDSAEAHDRDSDFGVLFERDLLLKERPS